jgi:hypothetical protein
MTRGGPGGDTRTIIRGSPWDIVSSLNFVLIINFMKRNREAGGSWLIRIESCLFVHMKTELNLN